MFLCPRGLKQGEVCSPVEMQGVGNVNLFTEELKLRLVDCFKQDWHAALDSHDF